MMGDTSSPTSGILFSERRPQHLGDLGRLLGAPATSAPDANQVGWGGHWGGHAILKSGGISTHYYRHLLGIAGCVLLKLFHHSLMRLSDVRTKDLEVSQFSSE